MAKGSKRLRGNNKWQLEVDLGMVYDPISKKKKRKKKYKTIEAKGSRQADKELTRFVAEVTGDTFLEPEKMSFNDFVLKQWLPKHGVKHLSKSTLATYKNMLNKRILPAFKGMKLDQIKPLHIMSFLENLEEEGMRADNKSGKLSSGSIEYHHRILRNVFKCAVEWRLLKESPAAAVKKPKRSTKEVRVYEDEEVERVLLSLESELLHWQVLIKLLITTGLRRSEVLGIELKHIDLTERTLSIRQALTYTKENGYVIDETKTKSSNRVVSYPSSLQKDIKQLINRRKREILEVEDLWMDGKHRFLFSDIYGKPLNPSTVTTWWKRFLDRHHLPRVTLHGLRHTSATFLINQGVHAKIISERLGHSDIRVTMNTYGHVLRKAEQSSADKFDTFLNRKSE